MTRVHLVLPDSPDEQYAARQRRHRLVVGALLALLLAGIAFSFARRKNIEPVAPPPLMQEKPAVGSGATTDDSALPGPVPHRLLVGGFADEGQAARAARRLRVDGWRVEVLAPEGAEGQYVVQVGPLSDKAAAEEAAKTVRAATGGQVRVVPLR